MQQKGFIEFFKRVTDTDMYGNKAAQSSKAFVFIFTAFLIYFVFFTDYTLSLLSAFIIWIIGIFVASILFAMASLLLQLFFTYLAFLFNNKKIDIFVTLLNNLVDIAFYVLMFFALDYFLKWYVS